MLNDRSSRKVTDNSSKYTKIYGEPQYIDKAYDFEPHTDEHGRIKLKPYIRAIVFIFIGCFGTAALYTVPEVLDNKVLAFICFLAIALEFLACSFMVLWVEEDLGTVTGEVLEISRYPFHYISLFAANFVLRHWGIAVVKEATWYVEDYIGYGMQAIGWICAVLSYLVLYRLHVAITQRLTERGYKVKIGIVRLILCLLAAGYVHGFLLAVAVEALGVIRKYNRGVIKHADI